MAWPSTIDYYRAICKLSVDRHRQQGVSGPPPIPEISIESLNINKSFRLRGGRISDDGSWSAYDNYFRDALQRLEASGAEIAIIASNTPHNRFESITNGVQIPVISIFSAVGEHCQAMGFNQMLILGTAPTMDSPMFADVLKTYGITGYAPESTSDRAEILNLIGELYADSDNDAAERISRVVRNSTAEGASPRVACLACTELPLAFRAIESATEMLIDDIVYVNTTRIHARATFQRLQVDA